MSLWIGPENRSAGRWARLGGICAGSAWASATAAATSAAASAPAASSAPGPAPLPGEAFFSSLAHVPGVVPLVVAILIGSTWWLVHLLFSKAGDEESETEVGLESESPAGEDAGDSIPEAPARPAVDVLQEADALRAAGGLHEAGAEVPGEAGVEALAEAGAEAHLEAGAEAHLEPSAAPHVGPAPEPDFSLLTEPNVEPGDPGAGAFPEPDLELLNEPNVGAEAAPLAATLGELQPLLAPAAALPEPELELVTEPNAGSAAELLAAPLAEFGAPPAPDPTLPAAAAAPDHWGEDFAPLPDPEPRAADPDPLGRYLDELDLLQALEERLAACPDVESALAAGVDGMREAFGLPAVAAWIDGIDDGHGGPETIGRTSPRAACESGFLVGPAADPAELRDLLEPWMAALADGECVCVPDIAAEPDLDGRIAPDAGSLALAPFPESVAVRGGLAVAWSAPLDVDARRHALARRLGSLLGLALDGARQRQELSARRTQARVLVETGITLSSAPDLRGMLHGILEVVHERLGYQAVAILLPDEETQELYVATMAGYAPGVNDLRIPMASGSVTATAARERRIVNVPEVSEWAGYIPGSRAVRSELALPLVVDDRLVGVLDVESEQPVAFDVRDTITLEAVASQAALVLAHSRLVAVFEERAARLQAADEMARAVSTTLDPHSLFQIVVEQARAIVGCDCAALLEFDPDSDAARIVALSTVKPTGDLTIGSTLRQSELAAGGWPEEGALYVPDLKAKGAAPSALAAFGFRSLVREPIRIDGKVVGLLSAALLRPNAFTPSHIATLSAVAPHVSAALRNARLYQQVERSYRQLNEAHLQLVQTEQLRVLGEMASGVAHNFNNVLGAILGRAQLVRSRIGDPRLAQEIAIIEQAATDGAATVRRLQEFTRLRTDHEFVPVDLSQVARDALDLTRTWWKDRAEAAGVSYGVVTDLIDGAWVEGQAHELREVVMNVVLNAVEAMPSGGSLVLRSRAEGGQVTLEITDTGVGMDEDVRSRIFHPFYSTKGPRGTGLGLSIAYGIVQRHSGQIEVESRRGSGTKVRLALPASERRPVAATIPLIARPSFQASILVVEDEPAIASLLQDLLGGAGYVVVTAASGREAVERLIETPFQAVLTDLGMPEMSGWELARHCRDLYPDLPVVLVTGWGVELDEELVEETGVRGVVSKPFTVTEVLKTIGRVLEAESQERKAA